MGHRILVFLASACISVLASTANALGLGEITLKSALNEPLVAEIELLQVRELTANEIFIGLASSEDFERIGVDRTYFLTELKFKVEVDGQGGATVTVTSHKPVREPFLNFVIEAEWPSGKLLREYTLLMDLPVFSGGESKPAVQTPTSTTVQTSQPSYSEPASQSGSGNPRSSYGTQRSAVAAQQYGGPSHDGDTYEVKRNDTLWEIAEQVRPSGTVSVHQTMIALQAANPNAFINNNINLLKSGQILRVPTEEDIKTNNHRSAVQEVASQNATWSGADYGEVSGPQLEGSSASSNYESEEYEVEGRVKLTSPDDVYGSTEGRASGGASDVSSEALENELSATMEQLDKTRRENSELRSTVESLEEQIETMERMLEVSNESLRALELSAQKNAEDREQRELEAELATQEEAITEETTEIQEEFTGDLGSELAQPEIDIESEFGSEIADETIADVTQADSTEVAAPEEEKAAEPVAVAEPTATPKPAKKPDAAKVVRKAPQQESSFLDLIMENILFIVLFVVALVGVAFWYIKQRSDDDDDFDDFLQDIEEQPSYDEEAPLEPEEHDDSTVIHHRELVEEKVEPEEEEEVEAPTSAQQTEDVVGEADIYIAYGKYDQAEEMLLTALDRSPQDENVLVKLLEVYSAQENISSFDPQYAKLRAFASEDAMDRAGKLRASIADAPEFDETLYDVPGYEESAAPLEPAPTDASDEMELSLDLDEPESETLEFESSLVESASSDSDMSMELDLPEEVSADSDMSLELDLPEEDMSLDLDLESGESGESAGDELSLDLDIEEPQADFEEPSSEIDLDNELDIGELELESSDGSVGDDLGLDLDIDFDAGDSAEETTVDLDSDLSLDLGDQSEMESPAEESGDLDFDLGDLDLEVEDQASSSDETVADELGDDLSLDLDGGIQDSSEEALSAEPVDYNLEESAEIDLEADLSVPADEDVTSLDLDLGDIDQELALDDEALESAAEELDLGEEEVSLDADLAEIESELDISFDDDELSVDFDEEPAAEATESEDVMDLGDLDLSVDADLEEAAPELAVDEETSTESDEVEDLELLTRTDLSALDEELDELTSDMDMDSVDLDLDIEAPLADEVLDEPPVASAPAEESAMLEEPVTDFDDLELGSESEREVEVEAPSFDIEEPETELLNEEVSEPIIAESESQIGEGGDFEFEIPEIDADAEDDDSDLDFLSDSDETATKLDLARAYIDMGDTNGAKDIIREILKEGNDQQKLEAEGLLGRLDS